MPLLGRRATAPRVRAFASAQLVLLSVPSAGDPSVDGASGAEKRSMPWLSDYCTDDVDIYFFFVENAFGTI